MCEDGFKEIQDLSDTPKTRFEDFHYARNYLRIRERYLNRVCSLHVHFIGYPINGVRGELEQPEADLWLS